MDWKEFRTQFYEQLQDAQRTWLDKAVEVDAPDLVHEISTEELIRRFQDRRKQSPPSPTVANVDDARLTRTLVWQSLLKIRSGNLRGVDGNLRSFWYREGLPLYLKHGLLSSAGERLCLIREDDDEYWTPIEMGVFDEENDLAFARASGHQDYVIRCFSNGLGDFVRHGIASYADFGFEEEKGSMLVGSGHASVTFYTEKVGLFALCRQYYEDYGITGMASNGEPTLIGMESFTKALRKKRIRNVHIGTLTDYDPWGWRIAINVAKKLTLFGFKVTHTPLTDLKLFDPKVLQQHGEDLGRHTKGKKTQAEQWFKITNGIHGQFKGIHVDLADRSKIDAAVASWLRKLGIKKKRT
jgi:hypothetical protein